LPINNALSTVGHVHGFLKEIGQGVQHIASRVLNLVDLISTANRMREITGEGFSFLKIPMSYYGFLSSDGLCRDAGVSLSIANVALAALQEASIVSSVGVVGIDTNAESVRSALDATAAFSHADALVPVILRARYNNIYKLIGDGLPESTYLDIVRNNILIDVQGKDMLCQIFTSNVLQRALGDEAPFLEFIQRICYEGNDSHGQPVPMRPGCGGFGIRNFLTLFLSIEVNKAMSDLVSARAAKNDTGMKRLSPLHHALKRSTR
jgi:4-hydroxyphenylpyruvate dioxygenase-like putative hemolysin